MVVVVEAAAVEDEVEKPKIITFKDLQSEGYLKRGFVANGVTHHGETGIRRKEAAIELKLWGGVCASRLTGTTTVKEIM